MGRNVEAAAARADSSIELPPLASLQYGATVPDAALSCAKQGSQWLKEVAEPSDAEPEEEEVADLSRARKVLASVIELTPVASMPCGAKAPDAVLSCAKEEVLALSRAKVVPADIVELTPLASLRRGAAAPDAVHSCSKEGSKWLKESAEPSDAEPLALLRRGVESPDAVLSCSKEGSKWFKEAAEPSDTEPEEEAAPDAFAVHFLSLRAQDAIVWEVPVLLRAPAIGIELQELRRVS